MSPWREKLQPASFRGVPFFVRTADTEEGRRGVLFEYPQRDEAFVEDMGRKAGEFSLEAIVIGPDYFVARDALREALRAPGPGELVHPTLGRLQVALTAPYRFSEDLVGAGGKASFSLRFTETGENVEPSGTPDTRAQVEAAADEAESASADDFAEQLTLAGQLAFVADEAMAVLGEALGAIEAARAGLTPDLSVASALLDEVSDFSSALAGLINTPAIVAMRIFGLVAGLRGAVQRPFDALRALGRLLGWESNQPRPAATTPARRVQLANQSAIEALIRRAVVIESARAVATLDFTAAGVTYPQAVRLREQLADALEDQAATAPAEVYAPLMDLRTAVVRDITARGADLPRLTSITLPATLPALVVAYRAYGDARRDAQIIGRNGGIVRHPGFVPGGVALEVLANG